MATALELSEKLLGNINETIREQEGREILQKLSAGGLWIGQGYVYLTLPLVLSPLLIVSQSAGLDGSYAFYGPSKVVEARRCDESEERQRARGLSLQRHFGPHGRSWAESIPNGGYFLLSGLARFIF